MAPEVLQPGSGVLYDFNPPVTCCQLGERPYKLVIAWPRAQTGSNCYYNIHVTRVLVYMGAGVLNFKRYNPRQSRQWPDKGLGDHENEVIKVITSSGGIMEFYEPTTAESITDEFPGHVIFRSHDLFWNPIPHNEMLLAGNSYYLLPLPLNRKSLLNKAPAAGSDYGQQHQLQIGHVRSNIRPLVGSHCSSTTAPYRMSFDHCSRKVFKKTSSSLFLSSAHSVARGQAGSGGLRLCRQSNKSNCNKYMSTGGIWKVKLVISPEQLAEILSQEVRTEELIESIRTVAKCGNNYKNCLSTSSESAFSDLWGMSVSTTNPTN